MILRSLPDESKRTFLDSPILRFPLSFPFIKSFVLGWLLNPEYTEVKESSGKLFHCQCGNQPHVPGVKPTPNDQGNSETCTLHTMAKAVVSHLDKRSVDVNQEDIEKTLFGCIGTPKRLWPSSFNDKEIKIKGKMTKNIYGSSFNWWDLSVNMRLSVCQVATTNQIPNHDAEYVLCTSYLSQNDLRTVYIEKKDEQNGMLHCINSWGSVKPYPLILLGALKDPMIFKIEFKHLNEEEILRDIKPNTNLEEMKINKRRSCPVKIFEQFERSMMQSTSHYTGTLQKVDYNRNTLAVVNEDSHSKNLVEQVTKITEVASTLVEQVKKITEVTSTQLKEITEVKNELKKASVPATAETLQDLRFPADKYFDNTSN